MEVLFNLISSEYERITPLEGEREYIFALGENEIKINIDKGDGGQQQIQFENLEYLAELDVEDYLTLSLYLNQDAQNAIWEWGFTTLDIDIDSDNNNGFELPDRSQEEEVAEQIERHTSKRVRVNTGDVNQNDIPDFAEFEYLTKDGKAINKQFVPLVIEIPSHVPINTATIHFGYSGSDPLDINIKPDPDNDDKKIYTPASGIMR